MRQKTKEGEATVASPSLGLHTGVALEHEHLPRSQCPQATLNGVQTQAESCAPLPTAAPATPRACVRPAARSQVTGVRGVGLDLLPKAPDAVVDGGGGALEAPSVRQASRCSSAIRRGHEPLSARSSDAGLPVPERGACVQPRRRARSGAAHS